MEKKHITEEELFFYVTGDLDSDTITKIEKHIQDCESCMDRLAQERALYKTIKSSEYPLPGKGELKRARKKLKISLEQLSREENKDTFSIIKSIQSLFSVNFALKLAGGIALFLVGLVTGLSISGSKDTSIQRLLNSNTTRFEKISFLSQDNDKVKVVVQHSNRQTLQLSADDPRLIEAAINILKYDERDNMRLKAMKILHNAEKKKEVEFALVESLQSDPNPGIRLHAIQILKKFPLNKKIKDVLVSVFFKDSNSGVRYEAKKHLEDFGDSTQIPLKKNMKI